jgi:hypothetical protein
MSPSPPTAADVARITAQADDVLRNLAITQCYHELSHAVRRLTRPGANWCTFATWASKQAGRTIRKEDLSDAVRLWLGASPAGEPLLVAVAGALRASGVGRDAVSLAGSVMRALDAGAAFDRAAKAVAIGNRMVFEEIGDRFARFLEVMGDGAAVDPGRFAAFVAGLRPGDPPAGQALLREAFGEYRDALAGADAKARAERLLHANLLIGLHEQTRLQPQIAAALDAAFDSGAVRRRLLSELLPAAWLRVRHRLAALFGRRPPLDVAIDALLDGVRREMRRVITATAMTLHLPAGVTLRLGRDVGAAYPATLAAIASPALAALLRRIDPTPDSLVGSGARDWADLPERLHLIVELFRCYHEWEPLFDPPFTPEQVEAIRAGWRPAGSL